MGAINFPNWQDVLECDAALSESDRKSYLITIRWFLSYCRKAHRPANKEQAYAFMEEACARKQPSEWVVARWKEAINWFFRHAPKEDVGGVRDMSGEIRDTGAGGRDVEGCGARRRGPEVQPASLSQREPEWRLKAIRGIRIRQFSYQTEKSYLNWLHRFARYWKTGDLESLGENEINLYLSFKLTFINVHERYDSSF